MELSRISALCAVTITSCLYNTTQASTSILFNPGPTVNCWQHIQRLDPDYALDLGLPAESVPHYSDSRNIYGSDSSCTGAALPPNVSPPPQWSYNAPPWFVVTHNYTQGQKWGGFWDIWVAGGWGTPIETMARSDTHNGQGTFIGDCRLREVTASHYHAYPDSIIPIASSPRIYPALTSSTTWTFEAQLNHYNPPVQACAAGGVNTAYVAADFVVLWPNAMKYVLSVLIFNGPAPGALQQLPANNNYGNSNIYYKDWSSNIKQTTVVGYNNMPGSLIPFVPLSISNATNGQQPSMVAVGYKSYSFKVLDMMMAFLPAAPAGYSWTNGSAKIDSAEIYGSVRGADIGVWVRNVDLRN